MNNEVESKTVAFGIFLFQVDRVVFLLCVGQSRCRAMDVEAAVHAGSPQRESPALRSNGAICSIGSDE